MTDVRLAMRVLFSLLFIATFSLCTSAHARMYQWVDADSGTVRLSGEPPSWYRGRERGPRVLVFEDGQLVDDTAVKLAPEQRKAYREAAFLEVDLRREREAVKKLERAALREARRREEAKRQLSEQRDPQPDAEKKGASEDNSAQPAESSSMVAIDDEMVKRLKALVSTWDQQNGAGEKP